jgi:hypothetical protein
VICIQPLLIWWLLIWCLVSNLVFLTIALHLLARALNIDFCFLTDRWQRRARARTVTRPLHCVSDPFSNGFSNGSLIGWREREDAIRKEIGAEIEVLYREQRQICAVIQRAQAAVNRHHIGQEVIYG